MPRPLRKESSTGLYHVTNRALTVFQYFRDDQDRDRFLRLLSEHVKRFDGLIHAWALLETHYHLVVLALSGMLSAMVQRIESDYGAYYNDRYGRRGHLVQDRFRSNRIETDEDVFRWLGYTHANITDARLATIDTLDSYAWCSYGALMGTSPPVAGSDPTATLRLLASDGDAARALLTRLTESQHENMQQRRRARDARAVEIVKALSRTRGLDPEDVFAGGRSPVVAAVRRHAIRACLNLGMTDRAVARSLGVTDRTVYNARNAPEQE